MTYIKTELTKPLIDLPPELACFGEYNAAIVAFRYVGRRRNSVPISRWVEMAEWAAGEPAPGAPGADLDASKPVSDQAAKAVTMTAVLDRLGLTKPAPKPASL